MQPTPITRRPTFTISPNEINTPGAFNTAVARYQATYPGDVHIPTQTIDLAPQIPANGKWTYVVRHADCSYAYVLVPNEQTATFLQQLPLGDTVISSIPPALVLGTSRHPQAPTRNPKQTPGVPYDANGSPITTVIAPPVTPPGSIPPAIETANARFLATRTSGNQSTPMPGRTITPTPSH